MTGQCNNIIFSTKTHTSQKVIRNHSMWRLRFIGRVQVLLSHTPVFWKLTHTQRVEVQSELPSSVSAVFEQLEGEYSHIVRYDTNPPAIQKQHWHSREAQIEPPLFECEWAFRIQVIVCETYDDLEASQNSKRQNRRPLFPS